MKKIFIIIFCFAAACTVSAQDVFIAKGKIEFERKVNVHKELESWGSDDEEEGGDEWLNNLKKVVPQFQLSYFNLSFDGNKTLYQPGRELPVDPKVPDWFRGVASDNIVLTDIDQQKQISQKTLYSNTFLITDSTRKIDWRITNDRRIIAGFDCRKAVGRVMDSVYVIAFYTDQITVNGGPESFCGLPGMILGVAIPRINTTWFATKLELEEVRAENLTAPKKGKKMNEKELMKQLQSSLKDWGKYGQRNIWKIMI